ncbi:MAG: reverse transcriptase domain-containing protein [Candidatus Omnitrophica bacterium]|nr:reverse transcriptase domain-containing protein [Candidatus Omnitrophota bacterium]
MKRINNIFENIISLENLRLADEMARRGKKSTYGVCLHDKNRERNILILHQTLKEGRFKTSPYKTFFIYEPKEREIFCLPYYPDRIVHWAIMLQLEKIWMNVFTTDTYSCIKGRGIHGAAKKIAKAMRNINETKYCLKLDISKFYPTIDQDIMMSIVHKKIKCVKTLALLDEIIHSSKQGLPIGNYISQFAANLYLTYFDHWIKEVMRVKYYFRYCDDIVILSNNKVHLHQLLKEIQEYIQNNLNLKVKSNYQIFPVDSRGIDFVGYRFYHNRVMLRKGIKKNMMRKKYALNKLGIEGKEYKRQMASYFGWPGQDFVSGRNLFKLIAA